MTCAPQQVAPRTDARHAVQGMLAGSEAFAALNPDTKRDIAGSLARIGSTALDYHEAAAPRRRPLATAQNAGSEFSGVATDRVGRTVRDTLNAVSFPRFVNELITGVFKAMNDSQQQQLTAFVDLIRNVAQTTEGFADANVGVSGARAWLAEHFPTSYEIEGGEEVDIAAELEGLEPAEARERQAEIQAEQDAATRLMMRPGATPPTEAALRTALGAPEGVPLPGSDPEALVPLARQVLARNRQQLLATLIQMGLQRIVIESGRVNAAMKLHVDASSAAESDRGSAFDTRTTAGMSGSVGFGPWGASANVQSTIGYVSTERNQSTEAINSSVDLDSGVELVFRTDYVPLDRLAGGPAQERIRVNTLNPAAEAARLTAEADDRATASRERRAARSTRLDTALRPPPDVSAAAPAASRPAPPAGGTGATGVVGSTSGASIGAGGSVSGGGGTAHVTSGTSGSVASAARTPASAPAAGGSGSSHAATAPGGGGTTTSGGPGGTRPTTTIGGGEAPTGGTARTPPPPAGGGGSGAHTSDTGTGGATTVTDSGGSVVAAPSIGEQVGTAVGGTAGGAIGTAVGGPIGGAVGGAVGSAVGGAVGKLF